MDLMQGRGGYVFLEQLKKSILRSVIKNQQYKDHCKKDKWQDNGSRLLSNLDLMYM